MPKEHPWIWLPDNEFSHAQHTRCGAMTDDCENQYAVAAFKRVYSFKQNVSHVELLVSGDTAFRLSLNGDVVATGPATVGGDFIGNDTPREQHYAYQFTVTPDCAQLTFEAVVRMGPVQICEYSMCHGGFMLMGEVVLQDGSREAICTDPSWQVCYLPAYVAPCSYDGRNAASQWVQAEKTEDVWHCVAAPIPPRAEHVVMPENSTIALQPGEKKDVVMPLDRIYAAFVQAASTGAAMVTIRCAESDEQGTEEKVIFSGADDYRGFSIHSAGCLYVHCENDCDEPVEVKVSLVATHYPCEVETEVVTSDEEINLVLDTCKHTLKYCRQTHHLDSPRHCEPLACTGDYHIESLMTLFSFGDMRLAAFDVMRTARMLERHDGRMFHTTYSLIWVRMLRDVYLATGDEGLLRDCEKGLKLLLDRFATYLGDNGLIETPPDYMFVDWIYIDGLSMHHPPKALGQSCLNMYYFAALEAAEEIYQHLHQTENAEVCRRKRDMLGTAIRTHLYDADKKMFFEGLNTPTDPEMLYMFLPENVEKRYYLKHANILAACFGVCDDETARALIERIMADEIAGDIQPYFTHYLLEAVNRLELCEKYTLPIIRRWVEPVKACPKGLVEGFVKPEPTYNFDHSHAWGGTPLYSLPKALLGLKILVPGMKELAIKPQLLGLKKAKFTLHTPCGPMDCVLMEGEEPRITVPEGIAVRRGK